MGLISRIKTWIDGDTLTHTDQNAEFDNILNNLDPDGIEDASADASAMNTTVDPYPSLVASLATDLRGELQRLRYMIKQMSGQSQWYVDAGVTIPRGWYSKLICKTNASNPTYQIDIDADSVVLENSAGALYQATSVNLTVDIATSGANGLDTGAEAGSTWYYGWVIYNPSTATIAGLLSVSTTLAAITLPSGYTYGKLVTSVYNASTSNFTAYNQEGNYIEYTADPSLALTDGSATSFTDVDCSGTVSTIGYKIYFSVNVVVGRARLLDVYEC